MKEASGELSMTAIAVVAIAAIGVLFYNLIWPGIQQNIKRSSWCSQAYNCDCGATGTDETCTCTYLDENDSETEVTCPNNSATATPAPATP